VKIRIVDFDQFKGFVVAAWDVIRAYDATRSGGAGTALGNAVEAMRSAMLALVDDTGPEPDQDATCRAELLHRIAVGLDVPVEFLEEPGTAAHWATAGESNNPPK
jgi:hypothetical protein